MILMSWWVVESRMLLALLFVELPVMSEVALLIPGDLQLLHRSSLRPVLVLVQHVGQRDELL